MSVSIGAFSSDEAPSQGERLEGAELAALILEKLQDGTVINMGTFLKEAMTAILFDTMQGTQPLAKRTSISREINVTRASPQSDRTWIIHLEALPGSQSNTVRLDLVLRYTRGSIQGQTVAVGENDPEVVFRRGDVDIQSLCNAVYPLMAACAKLMAGMTIRTPDGPVWV